MVQHDNPKQRKVSSRRVWFGSTPSSLGSALWAFFAILICVHFTLSYDALPDYLNLGQYTRGLAPTPYQYRLLPMLLFRLLSARPILLKVAQHAPAQFRDPHQIVQMIFVLLSMLGSILATAGTLSNLTGDRIFSRWFSFLVVYMAYFDLAPGWGLAYSFPYDVPSLFFFSIGVYLTVVQKSWLYYLVYPLAALNRETICFLSIFFLIWKWQESRGRLASWSRNKQLQLFAHAAAQAAIWIGVKIYVAHLYAGNPVEGAGQGHNSLLNHKLPFNLHELMKPQQWPVLMSAFGFLLPVLWAQRRWIQRPSILWSCALLFPLWFVGMMLVGIITELRVFSELSAFAVPALALIVHNRFYPRAIQAYSP